jgi:hypothetical protein
MDLRYAIERLEQRILPYTCGLYGIRPNRMPQVVGSAFIVRVHEAEFIVTAAHVLRANRASNLLAGIRTLNPLEGGEVFCSDDVDVAVIRVLPDLHSALADVARVELDHLDVNDTPEPQMLYTFTGYPASRNKPNLKAKEVTNEPTLITGRTAPPAAYATLGIAPEKHIAIEYGQSEWRDLRTASIAAPAPQGMSGGAVWRIGTAADLANGILGERLIGVGAEHRNGMLVGVRIVFALAIIGHVIPEMRSRIPMPRHGKINIRSLT